MLTRFLLLYILICWNTSLLSQEDQSSNNSQQLISVFDKQTEFSGWHGNHLKKTDVDEVRIGFFFPEDPQNPIFSSINKAADLAIHEINESRGYHGLPYRLIRRWSNNPWGKGSKEMIELVYTDSVWAVIGSLNGAGTHIAEQIATKAWLPLISPLSADPTLNYIRIPWIFRLPPDYQKQATLIVDQGIKKQSSKKVGLISTDDHDGRTFAREIKDAMKGLNHPLLFHFQISAQRINLNEIVERALTFKPDALILFLTGKEIVNIISELQDKNSQMPLFIPWIPELNMELVSKINRGTLYFVEPFSQSPNRAWDSFRKRYHTHYGSNPSAGAALTYDAIYLLVHAIEKAGLNRAAIRDAIMHTDYLSPVTGKISWDKVGGNLILPVLKKEIANNIPLIR